MKKGFGNGPFLGIPIYITLGHSCYFSMTPVIIFKTLKLKKVPQSSLFSIYLNNSFPKKMHVLQKCNENITIVCHTRFSSLNVFDTLAL